MNSMKKQLNFVVVLSIVFVLAACRSTPEPEPEPLPPPVVVEEVVVEPPPPPEPEPVVCVPMFVFEYVQNEFERRVFEITNNVRRVHRLPPLIWCDTAAFVARGHSMDMYYNNFMRHRGSDGSTIRERLECAGLTGMRICSANIAGGWTTPEEVVQAWMESRYRHNILHREFTHVGVGFVERCENSNSRFASYWTQKFFVLEDD